MLTNRFANLVYRDVLILYGWLSAKKQDPVYNVTRPTLSDASRRAPVSAGICLKTSLMKTVEA